MDTNLTELKTRIQEHSNQISGMNRVLVIIGLFLLAAIQLADNNVDIATSSSLRAITIILIFALLFGVFQYFFHWLIEWVYCLLNKNKTTDAGKDLFYPEVLKLFSESFFITKVILTISAYLGFALWLVNNSLIDVICSWSILGAFITLGVVFIGRCFFYAYDMKNNMDDDTKNKFKEVRLKILISMVTVACVIIAISVLISICLPKVMTKNSTNGETVTQTIMDHQTAVQDFVCSCEK